MNVALLALLFHPYVYRDRGALFMNIQREMCSAKMAKETCYEDNGRWRECHRERRLAVVNSKTLLYKIVKKQKQGRVSTDKLCPPRDAVWRQILG